MWGYYLPVILSFFLFLFLYIKRALDERLQEIVNKNNLSKYLGGEWRALGKVKKIFGSTHLPSPKVCIQVPQILQFYNSIFDSIPLNIHTHGETCNWICKGTYIKCFWFAHCKLFAWHKTGCWTIPFNVNLRFSKCARINLNYKFDKKSGISTPKTSLTATLVFIA